VSDIDTGVVDSLKVLDPRRPIREADKDAEVSLSPLCADFVAEVAEEEVAVGAKLEV
jgi:hypothetical protein